MAQLQFLCCAFNQSRVAIPLDRVIAVVEGGPLTPLPFCAEAFEGLVDAIGQVVPQINLALVLGESQPEGGILMVVTDSNGSLALRVQQVHSMIQVDSESIQTGAPEGRQRPMFFKGELLHGEQSIPVLDVDRLAESDQVQAVAPSGEVPLAFPDEEGVLEFEGAEDSLPFLLTEIAGELFAFASHEVLELHTPESIRPMPGAPEWVLGLIDLRGTPVLALSTARLLGMNPARIPETCLIAELENGAQVAIFIDRAVGLERFAPDAIYAMDQAVGGVDEYLILRENQIVGIVSPVQLLAPHSKELGAILPGLRDLLPAAREDEAGESATEQTIQMLTVRIGGEIFGLTLERITRIQASVKLTPLSGRAEHFDGMADVGDGVVPVIDLRKQVASRREGYDQSDDIAGTPPCLLTVLEGAMTGILVDQVLNIRALPADRFQPVADASKIPVSHVVHSDGQLIGILKIDRLFPAA